MRKSIFRGKMLVDKKFQGTFILYMLIIVMVIVIALSILFITSTSRQIKGSVYSKIIELKNTKEIIIPSVLKMAAIIILLAGSFILLNLLIYTHRIVGPMVRFKKYLKNLGDGDLTVRIKFREKDKLKELADLLTTAASQLNKSIKRRRK